MTSSPPTEPLAVQVMQAVLSSRLPAAPDQRQAIVDALAVNDSICVRVAIGHSECEARCTRSAPVELWSVRVEEGQTETPPLPAIFLLNAVRSYVHFSQLSAWLRPATGGLEEGDVPPAAASYELLLACGAPAAALLAPPADATLAEHAFPLAADATRGRVVRVAVRYVQRARALSPRGLCLQLGRMPTDEWLLGASPLPSPTGMDEGPMMMGPASPTAIFDAAAQQMAMRGGKHKASESSLYSPTGPALKLAHFGAEEEKGELVIECARDEAAREDTVVDETKCTALEEMIVERKEEGTKEEGETRVKRRTMVMKEKKTEEVKKERSAGGLRRMVGGWEESVLRGALQEKQLPQARYTLTIVAPSAPPLRLSLSTASLADSVTPWCVARTTVTECERLREVSQQDRKTIRRRGQPVKEAGQMQMSLLNAEGTPLTTFAIPYDVRQMPADATTIVRHRVRLASKDAQSSTEKSPLRYLVQLSISRDRTGRCFLTGEITVVFTTDASVDGANVEMDPVTGVARAADLYELRAETIMAPFSLKAALVVV